MKHKISIVALGITILLVNNTQAATLQYTGTCNAQGITSVTLTDSTYTGNGFNPPPETNSFMFTFVNGEATNGSYWTGGSPNYFAWSTIESFWNTYGTLHIEVGADSFEFEPIASTTCNGSFNPFDTKTRVDNIISPENESNQFTTTVTFMGSYYLNSNYADYAEGSFLQILLTPRGQYASTTQTIHIPLTATNTLALFEATTTVENNMRYSWSTQIYCSRTMDWYGTCDESTGLWHTGFYQFTTGQFDPTYGQDFDLSVCNVLSGFDPDACIYNLIFPNNVAYPRLMSEAKEKYAQAWPIGYVTRFLTIMSSTTPVKPPLMTMDLPIVGEFQLDPWDSLMGETSILGQATSSIRVAGITKGSGQTLKEITEPYWITVCYFALGIFILRDIMKHKK